MTRKRLIIALLAVFVVYGGYVSFHLVGGLRHLGQALALARTLNTDRGEATQLAAFTAEVSAAAGNFTSLQNATLPWRPLAPLLGWVPRYGPTLSRAPALIDLAAAGATALAELLEALRPALTAPPGDRPAQGFLQAIKENDSHLDRASRALERARIAYAALGSYQAPDPGLARALEATAPYWEIAPKLVEIARYLPALGGLDRPQTYLILSQNYDELRATGGFIGSAGLITVNGGELTGLDYRDSYDFDPVTPRPFIDPPQPYQNYLAAGDWRLRDANWWPDFPTSARQAEYFLKLDQGRTVDGVIAIDQKVLERLLEVLGPVAVPEFQETVDAGNVLELLDIYAHPPGYKADYQLEDQRKVITGDRKAFLGALGDVLMNRLRSLNPREALALFPVIKGLLDEKHLLIYVHEPNVAALLAALGWDDSLSLAANDYLLVVDTNVGYSKANQYVSPSLSYEANLNSDLSVERSRLTITYRNSNQTPAPSCDPTVINFVAAADSCYKDYLRVYVPQDSILSSAEGFYSTVEQYDEGDKKVFAGLVVVGPGATKAVTLDYVPPRSVIDYSSEGRCYRLRIQKQPGTRAIPLEATLHPPPGITIRETAPRQAASDVMGPTFRDTLETDREYQVCLD